MVIQISQRKVLNNLIRFKENLSANREKEAEYIPHARIYTALVNRHTGDIRFAEATGSVVDWEEVHFVAEDQKDAVAFRLTDAKGAMLTPFDLDPVAVRILFETLEVLNRLALHCCAVPGTLPENMALQKLSEIQIISTSESIESAPGWVGHLTRVGAEQKLFDRPPGTYLLRQADKWGEYAALALAKSNQMAIQVYALTFVESEHKIGEKLLIQTERGWTLCRDEVNLTSPLYQYFPSIDTLLHSISDHAKTPLR